MKKKITIAEAKKVWKMLKDNEFMRANFPEFSDYWEECERINNLDEKNWHKLIEENKQKLYVRPRRIS